MSAACRNWCVVEKKGWLLPVGNVDALTSANLEAMSGPIEVQRSGKQAHLFACSHLRLEQRMAETLVAYEKAMYTARSGMGYVHESARAVRL